MTDYIFSCVYGTKMYVTVWTKIEKNSIGLSCQKDRGAEYNGGVY